MFHLSQFPSTLENKLTPSITVCVAGTHTLPSLRTSPDAAFLPLFWLSFRLRSAPCSLVQDGCFHLPILGKSLHSFPHWWNSFYIYLSPLCLSVSVSLFPLASHQLLILIPFTPLHRLYAPNKPQASCCTHSGLTGPHVFPQCSSWLRDHFTVPWALVGQNSTWISSQISCDRSMEILSFTS